jgi:large subunit ribosomal protein L29
MKTTDYLKSISSKDAAGLKSELEALRREQFNLRMQSAIGQANQSHLAANTRKKIAQVKTFITQQQTKA